VTARTLVVAAGLLALLAAPAGAATTSNFSFQCQGPTVSGAYTEPGPRPPGSFEEKDFTIAPGEENGGFAANIRWASENNDWDLRVYRLNSDGSLGTKVAESAASGTREETAEYVGPQPVPTGQYRIVVDNWAVVPVDADCAPGETPPDWSGSVAFSPYVPGNQRPVAALSGPDGAAPGEEVTFDASASRDPDGQITKYSWDLDGNGSFETDGGRDARITRAFQSGPAYVSVRVTDNRGGTAFAYKTVRIGATASATLHRGFRLTVARRQRLRTALARGVRASVRCPRVCALTAQLLVTEATARQLGRRSAVVAARVRRLRSAGSTVFALRPGAATRAGLAGRRRVLTAVRLKVTFPGRRPVTLVRPVTLLR
jgi:YD repeat-containing protein